MFIYFTAQGFLARVHSFLNEYLKAVQYSNNAYGYVKKGFTLKDKFTDFNFSTGMYNYYREKYPELHPMVKPLAGLLEAGNVELGIKQLKYTYQHSLFSKIEAANYLVNIYFKYESKPQEVMPMLEEVVKTYPDNLFFVSKYVEGLLWTGKTEGVANYIRKLQTSGLPYYIMCSHLFQAKIYNKSAKYDEALKECKLAEGYYKKCPKIKDNMPGYLYMAYGIAYDGKGNKVEAMKNFKLAASKAEYPITMLEAKKRQEKHK
jgi:tetratricopeptide (TPR) repeat protein